VVRAFTRADLRPAVATLARAFEDDPFTKWVFPDERMRQRRLPKFFAMRLRGINLRAEGTEIAVSGTGVLGCAIWMSPGEMHGFSWQQLLIPAQVGWVLRSRLAVAIRSQGAVGKLHPRKPHWYLSAIGTDPPVQGTGVGSELMRSRLSRCDAEGLPAYLESSKESNVPFYQSHGFSVTRELTIPRGGPTLWLMWREPRNVGTAGPPAAADVTLAP
jgi:GNAT superfamily N-acetyltransferase